MFSLPPIESFVNYPIYDPGPASGNIWELIASFILLAIIATIEIYRRKHRD